MLSEHYKKYGTEGGVLLLDIKGYFPNAQHSQIKKSHEVFFPDEKVKEVLWSYVEPQFKEPDFLRDKRGNKIKDKNGDYIIIKDENPHVGMPLGLEPSQQEMINYPVFFDNWLTGQKHLRVQHYMDDYVVDIPPNVSVYYLLKEITEKAKENGMTLSPTKTRYVPLTKSFRYCKIWFKIGENGKIITKGSKKSYQNSKRRLDMFKREIEAGTHSYEDLRSFAQSSFNYYDDYMDGKRKWKLVKLFREYFGFDYKDTYMYYWKQKEIEAPEIVSVIKEWQSKILKQKKILESGYKYKCVEAYTGFNIFNDLVVIKEGDELISRQGILVCKNKPICLVNSAIAHAHFFYNEDKHAIRRGHLIEKIKEQVKHLQEGEVLNGKWQSFLEDKKAKNYGKLIERSENPYLDETWIWSDSFYYADIKDLEHLEKKTKKKKQYIPQDVFDEMRKEQEEKSLPKREKKKKKRKKKYKQWRK